ncbi:MAG: NUDIX domain-containing protein [bacterium]
MAIAIQEQNTKDSVREQIRNTISLITPYDEIERLHIEDALHWIDSNVEIFRISKPANPSKHLVCATVFVDPLETRILLLENNKAGLLLPNGGHVDPGELPLQTVQREVREEMSEEATLLFNSELPFFIDQSITVGQTAGHTDVTLWFVLNRNSKMGINDQSEEFKREFGKYYWLNPQEILEMDIRKLNPNMHRFVNKLNKYIK